MADKVPIRAGLSGASLTGLAIFASGETVGVAHGGTGIATAGSNQLITGNGTSAMTSESNLTFDGSTLVTTAFTASGNVSLDGGTFIFNEAGADKDFRIEGDSEVNLFITDASVDRIGIGTATPSHLVDIEGVAHAATCFVAPDVCATTKVVSPALCIGSQYVLPTADGSAGQIMCTDGSGALAFATASGGSPGGSDTYVQFNNSSAFGGSANLTWDDTTLATTAFTASGNVSLNGGTFVFNESGADKDFRIEGDSEANLFFVDASANSIGIGTSAPGDQNAGKLQISDTTTTSGNIVVIGSGGDNISSGNVLLVQSNSTAHTGAVLCILQDYTGASATTLVARQDGSGDIVNLFDGGTEVFTVANGGKVGIGTTAPGNILSVEGSSTAAFNPDSTVGDFNIRNRATDTDQQFAGLSMVVGNGASDGSARIDTIHNGTGTEADLAFSTSCSNASLYEHMRITSAGKVGIGTTAPDGNLHIMSASAGSVTADSNADELVIEGSGNVGITILSATTDQGNLAFGDADDNNKGVFGFHQGNSQFNWSEAAQLMVLDANNYLRLTSGGIQFNGDTADANSLDDYEEGTWTGAFSTSSGSIAINGAINTGSYTKIGRLVSIQGAFGVSSVSSPSGGLSITGLPFALHSGGDDYEWRTAGSISPWAQSGDMSGVHLTSGPGDSYMRVENNGTNAEASKMVANTELRFQMSYMTN